MRRQGLRGIALAIVGVLWTPVEPARAEERAAAMDLAGPWRYLPNNGPGDLCAPSVDDSRWATMALPSSWFLLGGRGYPAHLRAEGGERGDIDTGALPDPDPALGLDWSGTVFFRRTVEWSGALPAGDERVLLDLDMVDYYADAVVNGVVVGHHEGYFQRFAFDVTRALRPGKNLVCLRVSAPAMAFDPSEQHPRGWPRRQDQVKGVFAYHDARPGGTGPRGQSRSTGGVLRGLSLRRSSGLDLASLSIRPVAVAAERATLSIEATIDNRSDRAVDVVVEGEIVPANFESPLRQPVRLAWRAGPGSSSARVEVTLDRPALWWTRDRGRPNLHRLQARLTAGGRLRDDRSETFGVRSIEHDDGWVFRLNGQRLYLRGTNYIATQWLSQADRAFYQRDLSQMVEAGLNTFRVHAHVARPELYDLADELGLLVWQDFPLQWGYAEDAEFRAEALKQAAEMIGQLGNHPSIGIWCMHNEAPYAMGWMKRRDPEQNRVLDDALLALAKRLDTSRVVQRDSGTGDGHYYFGWYHDKPGTLRPLPPFVAPLVTEYGAQALPTRALLERVLPPGSLWPTSDEGWAPWRYINFQPNFTFNIAKVDRGKDLDQFVERSQRYQAALLRFQTEVLRRAKWTRSTGVYQFMFVDPWPGITWSVIDYDRIPKAGYGALAASMQPVLPSIEFQIDDPARPIAIHVINDRLEAYPGAVVEWWITDVGGALAHGQQPVDVPADGVLRVVELGPWPKIAAGRAHLKVTLTSAKREVLGTATLEASDYVLWPVPSSGSRPK